MPPELAALASEKLPDLPDLPAVPAAEHGISATVGELRASPYTVTLSHALEARINDRR